MESQENLEIKDNGEECIALQKFGDQRRLGSTKVTTNTVSTHAGDDDVTNYITDFLGPTTGPNMFVIYQKSNDCISFNYGNGQVV